MLTKKAQSGFVLMEILVSLLIFSIGIVVLVQSLSLVTKSSQAIRENHKAMLLIDNLLNRLYSQERLSLFGEQIVDGKAFTWQIDTQQSAPGFKDLIIKVSWRSRSKLKQAVFEHEIIAFK